MRFIGTVNSMCVNNDNNTINNNTIFIKRHMPIGDNGGAGGTESQAVNRKQ